MPELPEVEAVRRQLRRVMEGARIERVETRRADLRLPFPPDFAARLEGQRVRSLQRRAKYLLVELESGETLLMHLGMSGSFRVVKGSRDDIQGSFYFERSRLDAHDHVLFTMSSGATIVFNDPRRFGLMSIVPAGELTNDRALKVLGPEPLDKAFNTISLARALKGKKTSLKAALSDQRVVAGLGNIYVCEALHRARLSPKRRASTLVTAAGQHRPGAEALVEAIREVLKEAIANRHRLQGNDRFRVYDREGQRCPRRGCPGTIKRIVQAGRSTFFCPVCQR
ncbi:MAG TPA: bifunctional DNA-formamidopyrimidine glycosylase/DNA-(apurinic or apyrimidinic site) lyase [Vicinamibacterales bacterium]|nr:bifunctional DNA-formamidopyrimidine glycosylase/DNA-(apurinic or apyrimidinic site) lyase [Vicinamibacterales bacterium]